MASNRRVTRNSTFCGFGTTSETFARQQHYYPYRQLLTRRYLRSFVTKYQTLLGKRLFSFGNVEYGGLAQDFLSIRKAFLEEFLALLNTDSDTLFGEAWRFYDQFGESDYPSKSSSTPPSYFAGLSDKLLAFEFKLALAFTGFVNWGRHIFDIPQVLFSAFKDTQIEDIPVEDIKLPFRSFYLHFGQTGYPVEGYVHPTEDGYFELLKELRDSSLSQELSPYLPSLTVLDETPLEFTKHYLEGAYIQQLAQGGFEIAVIAVPEHQLVTSTNWVDYPTEALFTRLPLIHKIHKGITIGEALNWEQLDIKRDQLSAFSRKRIPPSLSREEVDSYVDELATQRQVSHTAIFLDVLRLVVNSLFYVCSYRDTEEIQTTTLSTTQDILLDLAPPSSSSKGKAKGKKSIIKNDYTTIKLCGRSSCKTGNFSPETLESVENSPQEAKPKKDFASYERRRHYRLERQSSRRS